MHGWEKSPSHTFLMPRFQKEKGEVCSVFKRGYLPSGEDFGRVSSMWIEVSSFCPEAESSTEVLHQHLAGFFVAYVLGAACCWFGVLF